ncbi:Uncharacterised protein [Streptococcus pneumoniae]|nr:Uncharacterised protein [Streptococcus pneumoniae]VQF83638.1 Uncharacterised protein [Streptococcus pneumoniae]
MKIYKKLFAYVQDKKSPIIHPKSKNHPESLP